LKPRPARYLILTLLLAYAGLYISRLDALVTYDEAFTLRHYTIDPAYALLSYTLPNNHLLHSLLLWASRNTIGISPVGLRFPALAFGLLSIAIVYALGKRLENEWTGLAAAALMGTVSGFVLYASLARGYSLSIFLTSLLVYIVLYQPQLRYAVLGICAALILTLPSMILLIGAVGLWALFKDRTLVMPVVFGALCGSLFYVPSVVQNGMAYYSGFGPSIAMLVADFPQLVFGSWIYMVVVVGAALAGVLLIDGSSRWLFVICLGVLVLSIAVQNTLSGGVFPWRNYLYILPLLCVGAAVLLTKLPAGYGLLVGAAAAALSLILWLPPVDNIDAYINVKGAGDVFGVMADIQGNVAAEDEGVVIGCCIQEPIWLYMVYQPDFFMPNGKDRVYIIETEVETEAELRDLYGLTELACEPFDDWSGFDVYACE